MKIVAHRGYTAKFPENSLAAFEGALKKSADAIEFDVNFSKDKQLVIHHDYYLPDGSPIYIKSYDEIRQQKSDVSLLADVFELLGNKIDYEIELRSFDEEFLIAVMTEIQKFNLVSKIEITSPIAYVLSRVKAIEPDIKTGMFVPVSPEWMMIDLAQKLAIGNALLGDINVLHCPLEIIDKRFIETSHAKELKIHAANCNTEADINTAFELGVDQFSTDVLDVALSHST